MSALIVFLPPQATGASAEFNYAVTADGSSLESHGSAQAALLPLPGRAGAEVVAVVPAAMLSWHRLELPKGATAASPRLRAVLEGLLEDQLLDEPEALHFALPPQARPAVPLWIAACNREWLRSALAILEAAEHPVTRIVPEFAPDGEAVLYAMGDPQHPQMVVAGSEGVLMLPLSAQAMALLPALPESTRLVAEPAVAALAEQILHRQPLLQQAPQRWVQASQSPWDLAQLEFSSSGRTRVMKKLGTAWSDLVAAPQWRAARWGTLLLVAVNLLGLNAWALRERSVLAHQREAIGRTLTQTFPQVKVVVDAPLQMEKEVAALRQATGAVSGRDLEAMLGALAKSLPSPRSATGLEFNAGELRVKGLAVAPEDIDTLTSGLKGQGYAVVIAGRHLGDHAGGRSMNASVLSARWQALAAREKMLVAATVAVVAAALVWLIALSPALGILRSANEQHRALDSQLQHMHDLQQQAQALQAQPKQSHDEALRRLELLVRQRLGTTARMAVAGERVSITLTGTPPDALAQWVTQARVDARALPSEARLSRNTAGSWEGTLVLSLPAR